MGRWAWVIHEWVQCHHKGPRGGGVRVRGGYGVIADFEGGREATSQARTQAD